MSRVPNADPGRLDSRTTRTLDAQAEKWGAPLNNHLVYARRPTIFRGVRAMWSGLEQSGLLADDLVAMINRRVAFHIGCVF